MNRLLELQDLTQLKSIQERLKDLFLFIPGVVDVYWIASWNVTSPKYRPWMIRLRVLIEDEMTDSMFDAEAKLYQDPQYRELIFWSIESRSLKKYLGKVVEHLPAEKAKKDLENWGYRSIKEDL